MAEKLMLTWLAICIIAFLWTFFGGFIVLIENWPYGHLATMAVVTLLMLATVTITLELLRVWRGQND